MTAMPGKTPDDIAYKNAQNQLIPVASRLLLNFRQTHKMAPIKGNEVKDILPGNRIDQGRPFGDKGSQSSLCVDRNHQDDVKV